MPQNSGWKFPGCQILRARRNAFEQPFKPSHWSTALALVIAHHVLRLGQLDVTNYGDRTDFRSTQISCMLEISGTATRGELARRHRKKVAQALRNPLSWDAYVVVCAFSSQGHRICISFHTVEEPANAETRG
jgi:hypothetical protein